MEKHQPPRDLCKRHNLYNLKVKFVANRHVHIPSCRRPASFILRKRNHDTFPGCFSNTANILIAVTRHFRLNHPNFLRDLRKTCNVSFPAGEFPPHTHIFLLSRDRCIAWKCDYVTCNFSCSSALNHVVIHGWSLRE